MGEAPDVRAGGDGMTTDDRAREALPPAEAYPGATADAKAHVQRTTTQAVDALSAALASQDRDRAREALRERLAEHRLHASLNICTCGDWRYIVADAGSLAEQHEAHRANALLPAVEAEKAAAAKAFAPVAAYLDGLDGFYGDDPIDDVLDTPTGLEADDGCALRLSDLRNVRAALAGEREGGEQ